MKSQIRLASLTAVALTLFLATAPLQAYPRDRGDRDRPTIVRIIKKIVKFFGIVPLDDFPTPPKP